MSIAPIMTAVELTLSPKDARRMANTRTQRYGPRKVMPSFILLTTSLLSVRNPFIEKYFLILEPMLLLSSIADEMETCFKDSLFD